MCPVAAPQPAAAPAPRPQPAPAADRPLWPALALGLRRRCPSCGEGALFASYLKPAEACSACGQAFSGHRADDLPPYLTILAVAHLIVPLALAAERLGPPPIEVAMALWPATAAALCLALLGPIKGAVIALQWSQRMHGFEDDPVETTTPNPLDEPPGRDRLIR